MGASAATGGSAGTAAFPVKPQLESGVRFCESDRECSGLECRAWRSFGHHVCAAGCPSGNECLKKEVCLSGNALEPTCFASCDWPSDCAYAFDCFDWYGNGSYVCIPAEWVRGG